MKQRFQRLTKELCERAVYECFKQKWRRHDIEQFIEKYAGIERIEQRIANISGNQAMKAEAAESIGLMLFGVMEDLRDGIEPEDMEPVRVKPRPDGMTGKVRDIAMLCILHQLIEHIVKLMLDPFLKARITPTQHASIPGRGQTGMMRQIRRWLRRKSLGIRYAKKTDVYHAYQTTTYEALTAIIEKELPKAKDIVIYLRYLGKLAPGGHLIIGGYLDAWLFNLAMSYALRYVQGLHSTRRGKIIPFVVKAAAYMDDFALFAKTKTGIQKAVKALNRWLSARLCLVLKPSEGLTVFLPAKEEKRRKNEQRAKRACPAIDIGGYRISRTHVRIRKRIFKRARRQFLRAEREIQSAPIRYVRAKKVICYNGFAVTTNGETVKSKYHLPMLMYKARQADREHTKRYIRNERRILHALQKYRIERAA